MEQVYIITIECQHSIKNIDCVFNNYTEARKMAKEIIKNNIHHQHNNAPLDDSIACLSHEISPDTWDVGNNIISIKSMHKSDCPIDLS